MRIISGTARGRVIVAPKGNATRPTQDKIKESIFGMIQFEIYGKNVLDMFAGSGNMGLEALSREAKHAVFVDMSRDAVATINKNLETLSFADRASVLCFECEAAAKMLAKSGKKFDLVFMDPPYRLGLCDTALRAMIDAQILAEDCIVIAEHERGHELCVCEQIIRSSVRTYGEVAVTVMRGVQYE